MAITQYKFFSYGNTTNYKKYDVFVDTSIPRYYYATQDNIGQYVDAFYEYPITSWSRTNDVITLNYTKTGSGPNLIQGSLFVATGQSDAYAYYTGMAIDATSNYVTYLNPGPDLVSNVAAGSIKTVLNPCWTTGFYFVPSYSSNFEIKTNVLEAKFGDGYSQRQSDGLNPNVNSYNMTFENRSDKETKAILNFVQDKRGVESFRILSTSSTLNNDPNLKYTAKDPKVSQQNYNSNTVSLTLTQVFDK